MVGSITTLSGKRRAPMALFRALSAAVLSLIAAASYGQQPQARRYQLMSPGEAVRVAQELLKDEKVPVPPGLGSSWKVPEAAENAKGFTIGQNDYVILAIGRMDFSVSVPRLDLPKVFPLAQGATTETSDEKQLIRFFPNGFLYSTVDLEVAGSLAASYTGEAWTAAKPVINRGGHVWNVGQAGVLLTGRGDYKLLGFRELLSEDFSDAIFRLYPIELVVQGPRPPAGISVRIAGQSLTLR